MIPGSQRGDIVFPYSGGGAILFVSCYKLDGFERSPRVGKWSVEDWKPLGAQLSVRSLFTTVS